MFAAYHGLKLRKNSFWNPLSLPPPKRMAPEKNLRGQNQWRISQVGIVLSFLGGTSPMEWVDFVQIEWTLFVVIPIVLTLICFYSQFFLFGGHQITVRIKEAFVFDVISVPEEF